MPDIGERSDRVRILKGSGEVECCLYNSIDGRSSRYCVEVGKKFDGAGDAFGLRFGNIYSVASVMLWNIADVPSV